MSNAIITDEGQELCVGDVWHVVFMGERGVHTCRILELSNQTVVLEKMPRSYFTPRLLLKGVSFIERVERKSNEQ